MQLLQQLKNTMLQEALQQQLSTVIQVDVTYLHIKEWIDCIRNGETPSGNIERAFEEGVTTLMAHKSYVEKRRVEWDPVNRKIV